MEVIRVADPDDRAQAVRRARDVLQGGGLVVLPTETVYGVAARADDPNALSRLREVKSRKKDEAFTVHIGKPSDADRFVPRIPGLARRFIRKGWPGPLTLILDVPDPSVAPIMQASGELDAAAIYHQGTVGLRCPDDPLTGRILCELDAPVVAASANRKGDPPPRDGREAKRALGQQVDLLLDAGPTRYARPSTIVKVSGSSFHILREGVYDRGIVERLARLRILFVCTGNTCRSPMAAGLARKMLAERIGCNPEELERRGIEILSAGVGAGGGPASEGAKRAMAARGVDLSRHAARPVDAQMLHQADHIFAMTEGHRKTLVAMAPSCEDRVRLLLKDRDVRDPVGGDEEVYESCARLIEEGVAECLQEVEI